MSGMGVPFPASGVAVSLIPGIGDALTFALGEGMIGVVTSGQGEDATLPSSVMLPHAQRRRLKARARIRYTKDLFISILLSVFAELLCAVFHLLYVMGFFFSF